MMTFTTVIKNSLENLFIHGNILQDWIGPLKALENLKRQHLDTLTELYLNNTLLGFSLACTRKFFFQHLISFMY